MSDFLQRVHEAKARYTMNTCDWPDQLFLGPKECAEFEGMLNSRPYPWSETASRRELAGMTIIGLMSDGLRVGHTVE